jgi:Domain of unknown function (DUF4383)
MSDRTTTGRGTRTNVQKANRHRRRRLPLVGVLGFIPGITTNFGDLSFAGHHSDARLFGLFQVSILDNIVHLLFGIAGSAMARTAAQARTYLVFGGAIYLVLFLYGLIVGQESAANFVRTLPTTSCVSSSGSGWSGSASRSRGIVGGRRRH